MFKIQNTLQSCFRKNNFLELNFSGFGVRLRALTLLFVLPLAACNLATPAGGASGVQPGLQAVVGSAALGTSTTPETTAAVESAVKVFEVLEVEFPPADAAPNLRYQPLTAAFADPMELVDTTDPGKALERLRGVSSATTSFNRDLLAVVERAVQIDALHLALVMDGTYYPWASHQEMFKLLESPQLCDGLVPAQCQVRTKQIRDNVALAEKLGVTLNQILAAGLPRTGAANADEIFGLMQRAYPRLLPNGEATEPLFRKALSLLGVLTPEQKLQWIRLADEKLALDTAKQLALDWFKTDSNHEAASLSGVLKSIHSVVVRDAIFLESLPRVTNLSGADVKIFAAATSDSLKTALACLARLKTIAGSDISDVAALISDRQARSQWFASSMAKTESLTGAEALALIRQSSPVSVQFVNKVLNMVRDLTGTDLSLITPYVAAGADRDQLILVQLKRLPTLTASEVHALVAQASKVGLQIALECLSKITALSAAHLVEIVDGLHYGPDRDAVFIEGANHIQSADLSSVKAALKQAYAEKVKITILLLKKLPAVSTGDLATLAKELSSGTLRDQLLLAGAESITVLDVAGMADMVLQADKQKIPVALALLSRLPQLSARDVGVVLAFMDDGHLRDELISQVFPFIKSVDGAGAAKIVERSMDHKIEVAMALVKMISPFTASDLDQILGACGSGLTRDIILDKTILLLGSLTKEEAKALHRHAYNNKEKVAILLMSKVDDFDGTTIAEIALLSQKGSSRDLIITEGLKRLKVVDIKGLVAMIGAADKLVEMLVLETVTRVPKFSVEDALLIAEAVRTDSLKNISLIRAIDLIEKLDESAITLLAMAATNAQSKDEVVRKGVERIEASL